MKWNQRSHTDSSHTSDDLKTSPFQQKTNYKQPRIKQNKTEDFLDKIQFNFLLMFTHLSAGYFTIQQHITLFPKHVSHKQAINSLCSWQKCIVSAPIPDFLSITLIISYLLAYEVHINGHSKTDTLVLKCRCNLQPLHLKCRCYLQPASVT